jgi:hypothetical protein
MKRMALVAAMLLACSSSSSTTTPGDGGTAQEAGAPSWQIVLQGLPQSLLAAWGATQNDVFAVGGALGNGAPAALLHYDGSAWKELSSGSTETFWWVHGTSDKDVWAVGTHGHIVHWDGSSLADHSVTTTATLYGVWAASSTDAWAVGGTPEGGTSKPNDVLLHWDGTSWTPSPLPMTLGRTFFKVWGTSSSNLYVVGEFGTIWHRTGTTWALEANKPKPLATGNLTTVSGCSATQVYAVGGQDVLVSDGKTWSRASVTVINGGVNGVSCGPGGQVVIDGFGGFRQRLVQGQWIDDTQSPDISNDFHGAWADPSGGFWAAGGHFVDQPQPGISRQGILAYYGTASISSKVSP